MRVKNYDEFVNEEINLGKAIVGGVIGAGSLLSNPVSATEPVKPVSNGDSVSSKNTDVVNSTIDFIEVIEGERPEIFTNEDMSAVRKIEFGKFEKLSFLHERMMQYQNTTNLNLDLDLLSNPSSNIPFRINYFYIRGLDDVNKGPFLIRIVNVDFTKAVTLAGHEIHFNFTRLPDATTLGTRINF